MDIWYKEGKVNFFDAGVEHVKTFEEFEKIYKSIAKEHQEWKWEQSRIKSEKARKARLADEALNPMREWWVKKNVKKGTLIKVKGTRDRIGLRKVIEVDERNNTLVNQQCELKNVGGKAELVDGRQITENGMDKVIGIVDIVNGRAKIVRRVNDEIKADNAKKIMAELEK